MDIKSFQDYVKYLGCDLCINSTRYPETNGLAERAIKTIKVATIKDIGQIQLNISLREKISILKHYVSE